MASNTQVHGQPNECLAQIEAAQALFPANEVSQNITADKPSGTHPGRFALFHSPASMSSEIARATFYELGVSYSSHHVDIVDPYNNNYSPQYVAMRLSCWDPEKSLVGENGWEWTGKTGGHGDGEITLDPMVVPTLVDFESPDAEGRPMVIVDCRNICEYVDRVTSGGLMPTDPEDLSLVTRHVDIVDSMPHAAMLYDGPGVPELDRRPTFIKNFIGGNALHDSQIKALERCLADEGTRWKGADLRRAYEAKLKKTRSGKEKTCEMNREGANSEYVKNAMALAQANLTELNSALEGRKAGEWILGQTFSMADLNWSSALFRLVFLGYRYMWEDLANIKDFYAEQVLHRQSIQSSAVFYEGQLPSYHTTYLHSERSSCDGCMHNRKVDMVNVVSSCTVS